MKPETVNLTKFQTVEIVTIAASNLARHLTIKQAVREAYELYDEALRVAQERVNPKKPSEPVEPTEGETD